MVESAPHQRGQRMSAADERLQAFRKLLGDARERLGLAVVFADEGAIAGLVRRPRLDTLSNLWVSKRIDIRNGTLFDLAAVRAAKKVRTRDFLKTLDKMALAKLIW